MVASQLPKPNNNLQIGYTRYYCVSDDWVYATHNGNFRYQSELTRAFLDWCDVAVFFKGDSGTLAELFHAIDTKKNREHSKPIIIINIDNQWNDLLRILKPLNLSHLYNVVDSSQKAIEYIEKNLKIDPLYNIVVNKPQDYDLER